MLLIVTTTVDCSTSYVTLSPAGGLCTCTRSKRSGRSCGCS